MLCRSAENPSQAGTQMSLYSNYLSIAAYKTSRKKSIGFILSNNTRIHVFTYQSICCQDSVALDQPQTLRHVLLSPFLFNIFVCLCVCLQVLCPNLSCHNIFLKLVVTVGTKTQSYNMRTSFLASTLHLWLRFKVVLVRDFTYLVQLTGAAV